MQAQREHNTIPEVRIRKLLHAAGYRYRLHRLVPGTRREIDIALVRDRVAVFVDGCFWHGCQEHRTVPRSNREWWAAKLAANRARDADTTRRLTCEGWRVVRIWEHEDPEKAVSSLIQFLQSSTPDTVQHHDDCDG